MVTTENGSQRAQLLSRDDATAPATQVVIIGAGPAGLTAAHALTEHGLKPTVLEKHALVGGLARTETYKGFRFDMGGHRFFTKASAVTQLWHEVLGDDLIHRSRASRIYYNHKYFAYPVKPFNALRGLGLWQSILVILSYLKRQVWPEMPEETFEQWVTNRFGSRLFKTFFKTYTEKVWGIPCSELKAEWGPQRIKGLSVKTAIFSALFPPREAIRTLISEFDYPRLGPGMMWAAFQRRIEARGGTIRTGSDVVRVCRRDRRVTAVVVASDQGHETISATDFISSMPITEFIQKLDPPAPAEVLEAAAKLGYRDFLTVCLVVNQPQLFPDNWIYIHDPAVKVGRIQNFKNWSPDMVPDSTKTSLGLEYFCFEGGDLWRTPDVELIENAKQELVYLGLVGSAAEIEDGCVFRVPKAYPVYDASYREHLQTCRSFVETLENFQTIGRNGLHRYNNQDHAMLTGLLAVRNLVLGEKNDLWTVNGDQDYHEEVQPKQAVRVAQSTRPTRVAAGAYSTAHNGSRPQIAYPRFASQTTALNQYHGRAPAGVISDDLASHGVLVGPDAPVPTLSVVLPALNEEDGLAAIIERILAIRQPLASAGVPGLEVIVVDDGSTDRTADVARSFEGVRLIRHPYNRGYGAAIKTGFNYAKGELLAFTDADGTYPPERFPDLCRVALQQSADVVVGSRRSGERSEMPRVRRVGNFIWSSLVSVIGDHHVADPASGMRVLRASALLKLYPLPDGLNFTPVMSTRCVHEDLKVVEVAIAYQERVGQSKLSVLGDGTRFLKTILWTSLEYNPVRVLGLVGLAAIGLAMASALGIATLRVQGVTQLGPWGVFSAFAALILGVAGVSIFSLGTTFNYLVSLFRGEPVRQGLFGRPLLNTPLDRHFGWLGLVVFMVGFGLAGTSLGLSIWGAWDMARLWLWLLGSAVLILMGLQLVVSWTVMRVLERLSLRELRIEEEFQTTRDLQTDGELSIV